MTDQRQSLHRPLDETRRLEDELLALLPADGVPVGNTYLRRELGVSEETYWAIRDSLVSQRIVGVGRGRGGSTFRVVSAPKISRAGGGTSGPADSSQRLEDPEEGFRSRPADEPVATTANRRPRIKRIKVENFKRIESIAVDLAPVTVLVGGNNAGKSSFLQGVHTAVSCAQESELQGQKVISEANLRFAPTHDFALLGHGSPYDKNKAGGRGRVTFTGHSATGDEREVDYTIEMYKGGNHKNVGVARRGTTAEFGRVISDPKNLFSVYVPGLSGILLNEESHGYASLFMRAARGDANLVFRNIVERLLLDNKGPKLEEYLELIFGHRVELRLASSPDSDLYVDVRLARGENPADGDFLPVELWGMGMLQVTQLFAYVLLFEPDLLLVDEPDSHLHPAGQRALMSALQQVASEMECRVVLSTHSRHIVAAAGDDVTIVWIKDGAVVRDVAQDAIPALMEMGALDKFDLAADIVIATEDHDSDMLKTAVSQVRSNDRIDLVEMDGLSNATMAQAFGMIAERVAHGPTVVVHRDRDCLTPEELSLWSEPYVQSGVRIFAPKRCDVESYFATSAHIAEVTGMSLEEADAFRAGVIDENLESLRKKFESKRAYANQKYWSGGGSPSNQSLWPADEPPQEEFIYGKDLLRYLKVALKAKPNLRQYATKMETTSSRELAAELEAALSAL